MLSDKPFAQHAESTRQLRKAHSFPSALDTRNLGTTNFQLSALSCGRPLSSMRKRM